MTWQYRVMRQKRHEVESYGIYEVYDNGSWLGGTRAPYGDTLKELKSNFKLMAEAFSLPVLDYKTGKPIKKGKE